MQNYPTKTNLILHFLSGSKRYFALSMLFAGLVSLLDMVNPKIISYTVDSVIGTKPAAAISIHRYIPIGSINSPTAAPNTSIRIISGRILFLAPFIIMMSARIISR